jgi:hypothetical protein
MGILQFETMSLPPLQISMEKCFGVTESEVPWYEETLLESTYCESKTLGENGRISKKLCFFPGPEVLGFPAKGRFFLGDKKVHSFGKSKTKTTRKRTETFWVNCQSLIFGKFFVQNGILTAT